VVPAMRLRSRSLIQSRRSSLVLILIVFALAGTQPLLLPAT
jgi:hypothetical protein